MNITLLTGIPRSGTTLCCRILNECDNTIALHEPLDPARLPHQSTTDCMKAVSNAIHNLEMNLVKGEPISHGASELLLDNPVSTSYSQNALRKVNAKRGTISVAPQDNEGNLVIKQNALFTALLPALSDHYPVVGIVRNPIPVLLSWAAVELPVNQGRIPAAERLDPTLKESLSTLPVIERRVHIYNWFVKRFVGSGIPLLRYEDIVASDGAVLTKAILNKAVTYDGFAPQASKRIPFANELSPVIGNIYTAGLYTDSEVTHALESAL